ncbi:hypothetical protein BpHYR1_040260, partial [Brachionus plicatilis]
QLKSPQSYQDSVRLLIFAPHQFLRFKARSRNLDAIKNELVLRTQLKSPQSFQDSVRLLIVVPDQFLRFKARSRNLDAIKMELVFRTQLKSPKSFQDSVRLLIVVPDQFLRFKARSRNLDAIKMELVFRSIRSGFSSTKSRLGECHILKRASINCPKGIYALTARYMFKQVNGKFKGQ